MRWRSSCPATSWRYEAGKGPLTKFLAAHAAEREKLFFMESAKSLWPKEMSDQLTLDSIVVVLPAFTVSQLREAFEIGFLLYLPFIAIDLIVSNILLAMGMMMVSPLTISLPFKLFLFVMIDGWSRLILGLVKTYIT
jgi:type III secretion protein R